MFLPYREHSVLPLEKPIEAYYIRKQCLFIVKIIRTAYTDLYCV
jgi:hypothetical protein